MVNRWYIVGYSWLIVGISLVIPNFHLNPHVPWQRGCVRVRRNIHRLWGRLPVPSLQHRGNHFVQYTRSSTFEGVYFGKPSTSITAQRPPEQRETGQGKRKFSPTNETEATEQVDWPAVRGIPSLRGRRDDGMRGRGCLFATRRLQFRTHEIPCEEKRWFTFEVYFQRWNVSQQNSVFTCHCTSDRRCQVGEISEEQCNGFISYT
jgi:hypothetical protein